MNLSQPMHIVLHEPDIPWNTGNIGRTCVATNSVLHLVGKKGFSLDDKWVKRAGLDYWKHVDVHEHVSFDAFVETIPVDAPMYFFSRFAQKSYWDVQYPAGSVLVFGSETSGLPEDIKSRHQSRLLRIPTPGKVRSLNLSTSVAIVLFEARRQHLADL